jgi:cytochrome c-type biogenesis protein CcmH
MILTNKRTLLAGFFLTVMLVWSITGAALGQDTLPTGSGDEVTLDEINLVAREIWCPLCSGVRLDGCELKACDQMKDVIAVKLAEGEDTEAIKQYFVGQYGPQVLGEPPRQGFNWLAWILPFVAFIAGGVFLWRQMGRMVRPAAQTAATDQETPSSGVGAPDGEYEQKLDEELTKYG